MLLERREFLSLAAVVAAPRAPGAAPDQFRYLDPATELEVLRLTDPKYESRLPVTTNRIFDRRGRNLLHASDRSGSMQGWLLDLRSGENRQVTSAQQLDADSLTLTPTDRHVCYLDGNNVMMSSAGSAGGERRVHALAADSPARGLSVTPDGPSLLAVDEGSKLLMIPLARGSVRTIATNAAGIFRPAPRPRRASAMYRDGQGGIWLAHFDGTRNFKVPAKEGRLGMAQWSPDGRTILYLFFSDGEVKSTSVRIVDPDTGEDRDAGPTSAFVSFGVNGDASVIVAASGSKAGPYVLIRLMGQRARELPLCEHKASSPEDVRPVFTPNSQSIVFASDRHGKWALHSMQVDKLVEKTEDEAN